MFSVRQAFEWLSAGRLIGDGAVPIADVCTDTRAIRKGCLFVALRGERYDAHDFIPQAIAAGAGAVLAERWVEGMRAPALLVADTRIAFGEIARGWRRRFELPVLAVTGSNGKTTVKEMLAAILATRYGEAHRLATAGNLNNDIGVPISVLRLREQHQAAVFELGMNRPGEIAWLAQIAQPAVVLVNNAQREHQEFMGSVLATAFENGAAISALPESGVAVYPGDDPHSPLWRELAGKRRCLSFGLDERCAVRSRPDARPEQFEMDLNGSVVTVSLSIDGLHNVRNALAAAACALAIGIEPKVIAAGLAAFRPVRGRLARLKSPSGAQLIDDSYNANPDSVRAAIEVLAGAVSPRVLVLGDMGEVGEQGEQFHREVIDYAQARGIDHLLALGEATGRAVRASAHPGFEAFDTIESLIERVAQLAVAPATVLVKGSRFMQMERVVAALVRRVETAGAH
ncbi:MAG: UDP-N-acetylmuramoyl-tripeptide--D-alanyl-D-alanine ligase [Burkholderiaceae bacterium]|nr:UDP-N-acetylmuramoyl-tripeptide--D-alanyl-D-alanine ligase [Burkholderiaceae bacterium]MBP7661313.1 UDP-N-acetylmuramoyl-tripeptide--D-alanyl-D-alanine ligase [Burkholderiaceae bacterium]